MVQRHLTPEVGAEDRGLAATRASTCRSRPSARIALGAVAEELIGRTDLDNNGVEGLELQLDSDLRGSPGWITQFRDGRGHAYALPRGLSRAPDRRPRHHADARRRSAEHRRGAPGSRRRHAQRRARRSRCSSIPRPARSWRRSACPTARMARGATGTFTDQYEPGSTFKVVAAGAALEEGVADPDQIFRRRRRHVPDRSRRDLPRHAQARRPDLPRRDALLEQHRHGQDRAACRIGAAVPLRHLARLRQPHRRTVSRRDRGTPAQSRALVGTLVPRPSRSATRSR